MRLHHLKLLSILLFSGALMLQACEKKQPTTTGVAPENSKLRKATDVFWALQELGYIAAKEKPKKSSHGCQPFEYLAKKDQAMFRISVFECPNEEKARALTAHPHNRKVDSLLRNHHDGGMLHRGKLQIIIRRTSGDEQVSDRLLADLEKI